MLLPAQDGDKVSVPFSDPSRPGTVRVELMHGDITVRTHSGKDVLVDMAGARAATSRTRTSRRTPAEVEGLKRIDVSGSRMDVEERENVIRVNSGVSQGNVTVTVPQNTSLKLKTLTGTVDVEGVRGEVEANSLKGAVRITNTEGSVVAHSLNGKVIVSLNRVTPDKAMAFSTMNGDIDVTMPADTKARLRLKNDHGEVWSDFEMKLESTPKVETTAKAADGKYKVKFERMVTGTINGGGPEMSFTTLNGQIRIRQKK